ncbi:tetratricopeptide repeat protein [soil metagenome]
MIRDVGAGDFEALVVERSHSVPVVVDFWAEWCGPCRQLGPVLEAAVRERDGRVELAKVDVDANQALAQSFGVRGIPDVKAFTDGRIAAQFTGAKPPAQVAEFIAGLLPSAADELAAGGDEDSLRAALDADPRHTAAAVGLARILLMRGEDDEARDLLENHASDFSAAGLIARIELEARIRASGRANGAGPTPATVALAAWTEGDLAEALELFQTIVADEPNRELRDLVRRIMVAIFSELGADDPLAIEHRRRLAAALN